MPSFWPAAAGGKWIVALLGGLAIGATAVWWLGKADRESLADHPSRQPAPAIRDVSVAGEAAGYAHSNELTEDAVARAAQATGDAQARAAIEQGRIPSLAGYAVIKPEVRYGSEKSRIDLHLSGHPEKSDAWVEVKNVTLCEDGVARFPDAVTLRGQKHLRELMEVAAAGDRAVLLFCVSLR